MAVPKFEAGAAELIYVSPVTGASEAQPAGAASSSAAGSQGTILKFVFRMLLAPLMNEHLIPVPQPVGYQVDRETDHFRNRVGGGSVIRDRIGALALNREDICARPIVAHDEDGFARHVGMRKGDHLTRPAPGGGGDEKRVVSVGVRDRLVGRSQTYRREGVGERRIGGLWAGRTLRALISRSACTPHFPAVRRRRLDQ